MKLNYEKNYVKYGITAFLVICGSILFSFILYNNKIIATGLNRFFSISMPIIYGLIFAYLLTPIINFMEQKILIPFYISTKIMKKMPAEKVPKKVRIPSILITYILVTFLLYGFYRLLYNQILGNIQTIVHQFPAYANNFSIWLSELFKNNPEIESTVMKYFKEYSSEINNWLSNDLMPSINSMIRSLSNNFLGLLSGVFSIFVSIYHMLIGMIISVYVLATKESFCCQSKKLIYSLFKAERANQLILIFRYIHRTFNGFLGGKIVDSIIIGFLCFGGLTLLDMPFPVLISVIVGVTNVIPFFGPYFGAIPSAFLILMVNPIQAVYFLLFILALQQFDGNILGPKILGVSTGVSGFWIICSITLFGGLFGLVGMLIGVPTIAVILSGLRYFMNQRLSAKELPIESIAYLNLEEVVDHQIINRTEEKQVRKENQNSKNTKKVIKNNKKANSDVEENNLEKEL